MPAKRLCAVVVVALSCSCAGRVAKLASGALNCSVDYVAVAEVDDRTAIATGCGRQVTYKKICMGSIAIPKKDCHWELDGR